MRAVLSLVFLGTLAGVASFAGADIAPPPKAAISKTTVAKPAYLSIDKPKPLGVAPGKSAEAVVTVHVKEGFHVQANPASLPQLIATQLELTAPDGLVFGAPVYPPGKPFRVETSSMEVASYDGTFEIRLPVTAVDGAKRGARAVDAKLRYQACNAKTCFPPTREPVALEIRVK